MDIIAGFLNVIFAVLMNKDLICETMLFISSLFMLLLKKEDWSRDKLDSTKLLSKLFRNSERFDVSHFLYLTWNVLACFLGILILRENEMA